jgi:aldose 1-epimerase
MLSYKKQNEPETLYVIRNSCGMEAAFTAQGAKLVYLKVPGKNGKPTNIVQDFDMVKQCAQSPDSYFTPVTGYKDLKLNDKCFYMTTNSSLKIIRSEKNSFPSKARKIILTRVQTITFTYKPQGDGHEFSDNLVVTIRYTIDDSNKLKIEYNANTVQPVVFNMPDHIFFNLNGEESGSVGHHLLLISADHYIPIDSGLIPTGEIVTVKGTPFDFTKPTAIGIRINDNNTQLKNGKGYDHNFVLKVHSRKTPVAKVIGDKSGILMEVFTEQPGLHFYSGSFAKSKYPVYGGVKSDFRTGFYLAPQDLPGPGARLAFPLTALKPKENYSRTIIYRFKSDFYN